MKTHGDAGWETFPSYLDVVVPRALKFLEERDLNITFFIVGQDAALRKNHDALALISAAGHEVGNHSFNHEPWLHLYTRDELVQEFERSESAIEAATGEKTKGFRGPGFSLSPDVIEVLIERGYIYDCSTFPTFIAPLARAYYFLKSDTMTEDEKEKRKKLFGSFSDGFRSLSPYQWSVGESSIVEIPVTTFPLVKTPIHASYIIYLATFSKIAAIAYWKAALQACKFSNVQPSILLHPLDFMTGADVPELKFFPGMSMPLAKKLDLLGRIIGFFTDQFEVEPMVEHSRRVNSLVTLPASSLC